MSAFSSLHPFELSLRDTQNTYRLLLLLLFYYITNQINYLSNNDLIVLQVY